MSRRGYFLEESWYLDHAAGAAMTPGQDMLLRSHLEVSPQARAHADSMARIGGALLETVGDESPLAFDAADIFALDAARSQTVAATDDGAETDTASPARSADLPNCLPDVLCEFIDQAGIKLRWEFLGPGLKKAMLWRSEADERLWLLRARPGVAIPHHGHRGAELTLVLQGSFLDGEQRYVRGDVEEADTEVEHDIQIGDGEECICLALTVGKLRFDDPLLRALQVFTGL
ncbi:ChrR family anti-sigma-E factor [uncultured Maricaulis sp.]|uniref:ChrR family anti-sigma-E factor n=1 Tax=uncultured Maricaulis sp. TaxID=174710 RepID=UPI0030DCE0C1|tara:strand:+ start:45228 stop:45920 length:693 start_codon:yes stop_codon:yes gene_type:complete